MKDERYNDIDSLIKMYIYPLLEEECRRLRVPREFILGIYGFYCKDFMVGYVEEVWKEDKLIGVRIRIGDCNQGKLSALSVFFHEMYHVKEIWERKKRPFSELRADLYAWYRILQPALNKIIQIRKNLLF